MRIDSTIQVVLWSCVCAAPASAQCPSFSSEFGVPGVASPSTTSGDFDSRVYAFAHFDSGAGPELYVGGNFTLAGEVVAQHIAMWDGARWNPVGASDALAGDVNSLLVFDDGSGAALFVGGEFHTVAGQASPFVAKWTGASWVAMPGLAGPGTFAGARDFAIFDDGAGPALFMGGKFSTVNGQPCGGVAKWTGSGWLAIDPSFPGSEVTELETYDLGSGPRLFIGGFDNASFGGTPHRICSWDGASFHALGSGLDSYVTALYGFDDGSGPKLYVGGYFNTAGGVPASKVARWDGATWSSVGVLGPDQPQDFAAFDDGGGTKLLAGCQAYGPAPYDETLMQWNGVGWQVYQGATAGTGIVYDVYVGDDGSGHGDELYIGGSFLRAGPVRALEVARLRNLQWEALGTGGGKACAVTALTMHDDGSGPAVYAASGERQVTYALSGIDRVERWDGSTWSALGEKSDGLVITLGSFDLGGGPGLYAGGSFSQIDGVNAHAVARWDGQAWQALGSGSAEGIPGGTVNALALHDDGSGLRLFAAGEMGVAGGVPVSSIAAWNGSTWADVGGGLDAPIQALAVYDSGAGPELYVGGGFSWAGGGVAADRIARWDGASWHAVGGGMAGGQYDGVFALAVFDDGTGDKLYAGGKFTSAGGNPAQRIAVWNGTSWSPVGSGANGFVLALGTHDDGFGPKLYAGGSFNTIGGVAAKRFARWTGSQWEALADVTGGMVESFASYSPAPGRRELWLAGGFVDAGGTVSSSIARWRETGACAPITYCTAKVNSLGCTPSIFASGTPSAAANNFRVKASEVLNNRLGVLFWGWAANSAPFQGGYLCVKPPTIRTSVQGSGGNAPPDDCSGLYSFHWNADYMSSRGLGPGQRIFCQYWSRDTASPSTTGLTDGLSFLIEL